MKKTVCVDLDGVLAKYDGWRGVDHFGDPIPGAVAFVSALSEISDVVIFTTRCNPEMNKPEAVHQLVNRVREWLDLHNFRYADIYCGTGKPIASAYVDDRAVICRPCQDDAYDYDRALAEVRGLVTNKRLGGTGSFPDGKLGPEDEGELQLMIGRQDGQVRIDFGKSVAWLSLPKDTAVVFARTILKHVEAL